LGVDLGGIILNQNVSSDQLLLIINYL